MGVILFIIALVATSVLTAVYLPLSIIYHLITLRFAKGLKRSGKYFYQMALSLDQFANVSLQTPLNLLMIKGEQKFVFGDEDDTVSYVIARNYYLNSLTKFGLFWAWFLNKVDTNHLDKAIDNKYKRDLEAYERINNKYVQ
jgi:hypothetical protein